MSSKCNVKSKDSNIRLIISSVLILLAIYFENYILIVLSILIGYSGITKYCFLYTLLNINQKFSLKNYYISQLPKNNPSAVFMFGINGNIYFSNDSADEKLKNISNYNDLKIVHIDDVIETEIEDIQYFKYGERHYQLDIKGIKKINSILVYATDITELMELNREIENTQKEIIYTMGEIGETRSKETGNHVKRVAEYSELLALLYGLSKEESKILKMASPMHDIGKIGIPDAILNKPARHTIEEFEIMKTHSQLGYDMLNKSNRPIIQTAKIVAIEHHEKYDGTGYPNGLKGEEINIYGRITAVADVFDALGSKRAYKDAWKLEKILKLFQDEKSKHFDPILIDLFLDNLDSFLKIRDEYKDA